jgi:chemotaxis protein methyltransferase CheR
LNGISGLMPDDGFLFLGGAETVLGITDRFQLLAGQRGVYGLTSGATAAKPASASRF